MSSKRSKCEIWGGIEKKCAKCGKRFISAAEHIYKKNGKWYCSWTCYNHRNERSGAKNEQSDQKRD